MIGFPKNPPNGMIFEASPGLFFEFQASEDCWIRVDGLEALGLATVTKDGLMSSEDFKKLNGLIIPPPQSTLKGEECKTTFTQGKVRLTSTDGSLEVTPNLQLLNKRGSFIQPWSLHENTAGYDFKLNFDAMLAALKQNGNFTQVQIQGKQGLKGAPGQPGINKLDTGPKGETGPAGKNSPFKGVISTEPNALQLIDDNANRAIVDIQAIQGPDGNFLVATRANIGNPGACPQEVTPKDIVSPQVLVLDHKENALVRTLQETNDCNNPCTVCVTSLHYVNMEMVLDAMFERFLEQLAALKTAKEELATTWLQTMITIFNEQKASLCCALENCKSTQRNANERRYLEQQRIQAAQANQQVIIDGQNDRVNISMNADKECTTDLVDAKVRRGVGCDCVLQFTLDGKAHSVDPRGLFLEKPPAQVDVRVSNAFQTVRDGLLQVNSEMSSNTGDALGPGVPIITSRVINVDTDVVIPLEAAGTSTTVTETPPNSGVTSGVGVSYTDPNVPWGLPNTTVFPINGGPGSPTVRTITLPPLDPKSWIITINNFSGIVNPDHSGTITITIVLVQGETTIATFQGTMPLAQIASQTITIPVQTFDAAALTDVATITANQSKPIVMTMSLDTSVTFSAEEIVTSATADYTLGAVHLSNNNGLVFVDLSLQDNWSSNDWTVNDNTTAQGSNNGFVQLSLPPGGYVAEIIECCVDMTNTRHIFKGTAAIEFNTIEEVTGAGGTEAPDPNFTAREAVTFPDMGTFNNNSDARTRYLGSTVSFNHQGGQIRAWVVDPDGIASNNEGSITICIKSIQCTQDQTGSAPIDPGAIFVYANIISPLNLIGIIRPFLATGTENLDAIANYGYNEVTADAAHVTHGPNRSIMTTKSFFYEGPDGLSFFTINGGTEQDKQNNMKMSVGVSGNSAPTNLIVADDPEEVAKVAAEGLLGDSYNTNWTIGTGGSDGLVIGYFDKPANGGAWQVAMSANDMGIQQLWEAVSADGNRFALALKPEGMGTLFASQQVIFTPIKAGCIMSYKQIQWLERGHRTGAACSCVVNVDGTNYAIVKRSIADDTTCGGGESLSNPCISQYIAIGAGHPAIAWPTANGEEFLGIPTSGGHGFMFDQIFSDKVLAKIAAGEFTNETGDPKANIPFVLVATS